MMMPAKVDRRLPLRVTPEKLIVLFSVAAVIAGRVMA